jgi:hypothetical protein
VTRVSALGLGFWALTFAAAPPPLDVSFHHVHVNDTAPDHLVAYYTKLFDRSTTRPVTLGPFPGVEAGGVYLLVTRVKPVPADEGSAGWHFGWGTVSLEEPYDRHRMQEIAWELPLESFAKDLHLHLESEDPIAAGEWYRDTFGAKLEAAPANAAVQPTNAYYRRPAAIVRLDGVALAIYKGSGALKPSRGHRIDHIAFRADLGEVRKRSGLAVLEVSGQLDAFETMTIEGPDQLAIELVGLPRGAP